MSWKAVYDTTEKRREFHRQWRLKNRDHVNAQKREWYKANKNRISSYCKAQKEKYLKTPGGKLSMRRAVVRQYGLSLEDYQLMLDKQAGKCAICLEKMKRPCIDHNHETGKVRALLCTRCNTGLSFIEEQGFYVKATQYLKWHEQTER